MNGTEALSVSAIFVNYKLKCPGNSQMRVYDKESLLPAYTLRAWIIYFSTGSIGSLI